MTSTPPRVLVVDDDANIRKFIARNLRARRAEVFEAANGLEALAVVSREPLDLIVLDIMMPQMDGLEACRRIRETSVVPIIVLTALGEMQDKVRILDQGADDVLAKPFGIEELLARMRSALRRARWSAGGDDAVTGHRGIEIDLAAGTATVDDEPVDLTRTELALLSLFLDNIGRTLPHEDILMQVWGKAYLHETQYVRVYVSRLRTKLASPDDDLIATVHGVGYRMNA